MKYTAENTRGLKIKVYDSKHNELSHVTEYNTKTRKVKLFLVNGKDGRIIVSKKKAVLVSVHLPDSYITINGKVID